MSAQQALELERLNAGRCPIHVRHNPACSICVRISDADKNLPTRDRDVELESELQDQIENYCRNKGWIPLRSRMDRATSRMVGEFDFTCILEHGVVVFCECKSKTGKLSLEQAAIIAWMKKLGHEVHVVKSFQTFKEICAKALSERGSAQSQSSAEPAL